MYVHNINPAELLSVICKRRLVTLTFTYFGYHSFYAVVRSVSNSHHIALVNMDMAQIVIPLECVLQRLIYGRHIRVPCSQTKDEPIVQWLWAQSDTETDLVTTADVIFNPDIVLHRFSATSSR